MSTPITHEPIEPMPILVLDGGAARELLARRREMGGDRYDEVWEGTYVMNPMASVEHQRLVMRLTVALDEVVRGNGLGEVFPGTNVTDNKANWEHNYRCPDVVVVLAGGRAKSNGPAFVGGPDFLIEVRSPGDRSLEKLGFYAAIGVRELLVVDRDTKELELYALRGSALQSQGRSTPTAPETLISSVLPLSFRHSAGTGAPGISVHRTDSPGEWTI